MKVKKYLFCLILTYLLLNVKYSALEVGRGRRGIIMISMMFSWDSASRPIIALAPIAGYTDSAYRRIVKSLVREHCKSSVSVNDNDIVCFSELTSVAALHHCSGATYRMLDFHPTEYPLIMQLFGKEASFFVEAGKILEDMGVAGIDINMGCPTTKITSTECGSALLRNPLLAADIVHALSSAVSIPVSVKTRLGYEKYDGKNFFDFCLLMEQAGAKLLTIHGRLKSQGFSGEAQWEPIYAVKKLLKIPVIGNGDIRSSADAKNRLKNLDGIMIGRATLGNPWLIAEIAAAFRGAQYNSPNDMLSKLPLVREHVRLSVEMRGEPKGLIEMRKHLASYLKGFPGVSGYVRRVMEIIRFDDISRFFDSLETDLRNSG